MSTKIYLIYFVCFFIVACNEKENIKPSLLEEDWAEEIDMNNTFIKECYEKYGVGILYDFDENEHFTYIMENSWKQIEFKYMERPSEVDSAIHFFQESFFRYFNNDEFIKKYFPRKILLSRDILCTSGVNYGKYCTESDTRIGETFINSLHSLFNKNGYAFAAKLSTIYYNEQSYQSYKMDNLYIFLCYLLENHNFYNEFGNDFYLSTMEKYYNKVFSGEADQYNNYTPGIYIQEGGSINDLTVPKLWYWRKGFVSTKYMHAPNKNGEIEIRDYYGCFFHTYKFPDKKRDVRNLVNQLLFVTQEDFDDYPEIIINRLRIIVEKMDEWGFDIRAINPVIKNAF